MKFSVCIAAFRPSTLVMAINSIVRQDWENWELIVVGQGIDNGVKAVVDNIAQQDNRVRYLHVERQGTCRARNAGMMSAQGDIIALIDDDCEAREDWLATMARYFEKYPEVDFVSGSVLAPVSTQRRLAVCPHLEAPEAIYDPISMPNKPPAGWWFIGCNVGIRRKLISQIGLFDESFGPGTEFPAAEDTDYMWRLEALGVKMASTPQSVVYHTHGYRYGIRSIYRQQRAYARANGGLAAKLTLLGDKRGRDWLLRDTRTLGMGKWSLKLHRLPISLLRLSYFIQGYRNCLKHYSIDPSNPITATLTRT